MMDSGVRKKAWEDRVYDLYVDQNIKTAHTLPPKVFHDKNFLDLELDTIFTKTWLFVPQRSISELTNDSRSLDEMVRLRGSQAPFSLLDMPFFLQRDYKDKGKLHCFPNACTHAWYPLVFGPGRPKEKMIICGQHGRQFDCSGKFVSQAGFSKDLQVDFPRECDNLKDLPTEQWEQFAFISLGNFVAPLAEFFGPVKETVAKLPVREFVRFPQSNEAREVDGNWKQHAWNYMDKFHITFIHRAPGGLADAIELSSYQTELHPYSALQWVYAKNPEYGFDSACLPDRFLDPKNPEKRVFALWWFVFPNMAFNFYPWGLSVNVYMPVREKPDKTLFFWYHYVLDKEKYSRRNEWWLNEQVDNEDIDAMGQASRGAKSIFAPRGRFAPKEEVGPHWFHRLVYKMIS